MNELNECGVMYTGVLQQIMLKYSIHLKLKEYWILSMKSTCIACIMYTYHASAKVSDFQESWNSHQLSSEGSKTPNQLFFEGITFQRQIGTEQANVTAAGNVSDIDLQSNDPVSVPGNSFKSCPVSFSLLLSVDPLAPSIQRGKEHYHSAVNLCAQHLQNGCLSCSSL